MVGPIPPPVPSIEWGVASRAMAGQEQSGDGYLVKPTPDGFLAAVVDGLGHGAEAASATRAALSTLESWAHEPVISLVRRCHEQLRKTRGVAMDLATFNLGEETMTWLGVGNVEGVLVRADNGHAAEREAILQGRGVVGYRLPPLRAVVLPLVQGDTLVFATDGVRYGFTEDIKLSTSPKDIADDIFTRYAKETDDALVLAVRFHGKH